MTTISKKEVHKFLDKHLDIPLTAAKFEYSLYLESEAVEYANAISEKMLGDWQGTRCARCRMGGCPRAR